MMGTMEEKRRKHGWAGPILLVIGLLPVAYPLSIGPAVALYGATGSNQVFLDTANHIYYPVLHMPEPFSAPVIWWLDLWDFYGVRRED